MSTRTSPRTARTGRTARSTPPSNGRFARSPGGPRRTGASTRRSTPNRYGIAGGVLQCRRTPPPSGIKGALGGLSGLLPAAGKARGKATPSSKKGKAGGFALLTAAAGVAFSNRDKLGRLVKRGGSQDRLETTTPAAPAATTTTPPATTP
jgi:hypothetical protein